MNGAGRADGTKSADGSLSGVMVQTLNGNGCKQENREIK